MIESSLAFYAFKFDFNIIAMSNYSYEPSPGGIELHVSIAFNIFMINCSKGFLWTFLIVAPYNNHILSLLYLAHMQSL